jgi:uncharacterized phage protein (TIGR01671 family)
MSREIKFRVWDGLKMIDPFKEIYDSLTKNIMSIYDELSYANNEDYFFNKRDKIKSTITSMFYGFYDSYDRMPADYDAGKLFDRWVKHSTKNILMQFTGLKDKNGKDIYEGDVVLKPTGGCTVINPIDFGLDASLKIYKPTPPEVRVVTYVDGSFHLGTIDKPKYTGFLGGTRHCEGYEIEVIGNIYEHSHLLEKGVSNV